MLIVLFFSIFHNLDMAVLLTELLAVVGSFQSFYGNHAHQHHLLLDPFKPGPETFYELLSLTETV